MSPKWQVDEADDNVVGGVEKIRRRPRGEEPRGARRYRKDRDNVVAEVIPEGGSIQMTGKPRTTTTEQVRTAFGLPPTPPTGHTPESDKESCPVCGRLKWRFFEKEVDDGAKKQIPVLVCGDCTEAYKAYRAAALASNARAMLADPAAEPEGPVDKFHWVLSKINLEQFGAEAEAAVAAYRAAYETAVVKPMDQRGYLEKHEWKGNAPNRPVMWFTHNAYRNGTADAMRNVAEESATELRNLRFIMRRTVGRLAVASRVKSELEAKLAQPAAPAESQ